MKKVISGHVYNTRRARLVGSSCSGDPGSLDFVSDSLYRTKAGLYFLHGCGGARTPFTHPIGFTWSSGENILPIDESDAREWAKHNLSPDILDTFFSPVPGDPVTTVYLPSDLLLRLDEAKHGGSRSDIVIKALRAYLA